LSTLNPDNHGRGKCGHRYGLTSRVVGAHWPELYTAAGLPRETWRDTRPNASILSRLDFRNGMQVLNPLLARQVLVGMDHVNCEKES
jgi:hypothetical protein